MIRITLYVVAAVAALVGLIFGVKKVRNTRKDRMAKAQVKAMQDGLVQTLSTLPSADRSVALFISRDSALDMIERMKGTMSEEQYEMAVKLHAAVYSEQFMRTAFEEKAAA
jgi:hypothetical protein